jgi:hypothetical protein
MSMPRWPPQRSGPARGSRRGFMSPGGGSAFDGPVCMTLTPGQRYSGYRELRKASCAKVVLLTDAKLRDSLDVGSEFPHNTSATGSPSRSLRSDHGSATFRLWRAINGTSSSLALMRQARESEPFRGNACLGPWRSRLEGRSSLSRLRNRRGRAPLRRHQDRMRVMRCERMAEGLTTATHAPSDRSSFSPPPPPNIFAFLYQSA